MLKVNQTAASEANHQEAIAAQRMEIVNLIGQTLADEYSVQVGRFVRPNLRLTINGQQFSVQVSACKEAVSLDGAGAWFSPDAQE